MNWEILWIPILAVLLYTACRLLGIFLARMGRRELQKRNVKIRDDGTICLYGDADELEFLIRCAIAAQNGSPVPIIVCIGRYDRDRDEMIDIAERMARRYGNLTYRLQ